MSILKSEGDSFFNTVFKNRPNSKLPEHVSGLENVGRVEFKRKQFHENYLANEGTIGHEKSLEALTPTHTHLGRRFFAGNLFLPYMKGQKSRDLTPKAMNKRVVGEGVFFAAIAAVVLLFAAFLGVPREVILATALTVGSILGVIVLWASLVE